MVFDSCKLLALATGLILLLTPLCEVFAYESETEIHSLKKVLGQHEGDDTLKVIQLNELAYLSFSSNAKELHEYSRKALYLARKLKYKRGEATALKNMALSYMLIHGDLMALRYLNQSLKIFSSLKDVVNIAAVTGYVGCYYATIKDFKQALPYFLRAEKLLGDRQHAIRLTILSNTGSCYEDLGQFDRAKYYYDRVKVLAMKSGNHDWVLSSMYHTASLSFLRKDYRQTLAVVSEALSIIKSRDTRPRQIQAFYMLMGDVYYQKGDYQQSRKYYESSALLAGQMKSRENMAAIHYKFHLLDSISHNYLGALTHFKKYQRITDSLINRNKNEIIARYKVKFALGEQESKTNRLVIQNKADQRVIFYQRWILFITLGSLGVIAFAFFRFRRLYHQTRELNNRIASQNLELEKLNGIKNKIFSVVAHDLRNPFAQFIGVLELVESQVVGAEEVGEFIPSLHQSVRQTMEMMDNLLIWSKSQMNGFQVHPVGVDIFSLIHDTLRDLRPQISDKQLMVRLDRQDGTPAWADKEMLRIVLRNLLSNAIKFTHIGGLIEIESYCSADRVVIGVKDSGVGMGKNQLDKLFSFEVKSSRGTANETGTGLGLKICQDLLELNGGKIWVESQSGTGSAFFVSLPEKHYTRMEAS